MKLIIVCIVGIFIGTWIGLLMAPLMFVSKREEEIQRQYWADRERERDEQDKSDH